MHSILFLFVIQAFQDTLQIQSQSVQFSYFHENKNGNTKTYKGRLLSQNTTTKGTPFLFNSSFYVDDSFFLFQTCQELLQAIINLHKHFARLGLIMHVGSSNIKSREAMFFPLSLKQANINFDKNSLPEDLLLPGKKVHHVNKFKYLGSITTPLLNEDIEIEARIKKYKAIMAASKHFFNNKDVGGKTKP